jgi:hypothetical protein
MKVSGQIHALAASPPSRERIPASIKYGAGETHSWSRRLGKEQNLDPLPEFEQWIM